MIIREEKPSDYEAVFDLIKEAFFEAEHSDGTEQNLVENLRKGTSFVPDLSLVAVGNDEIVGHILLPWERLAKRPCWCWLPCQLNHRINAWESAKR